MPCMLCPMSSLRAKCETRSLRGIFHTRGIGNGNKSMLIARLKRLGSESNTIGETNDLLSKTQHSSFIAADSLEGIEGHAKAFCAVWRNCACSQARPSRV